MDIAIKEIWKFTRNEISKAENKKIKEIKTDFISEWLEKKDNKNCLKKEYLLIENLNEDKFEFLRYCRRRVTHYYIHLTSAYNRSNFLIKKAFFDWYCPEDLIILDILKILEEAEAYRLGFDNLKNTMLKLENFDKFKDDCKKHYYNRDSIDC